MRLPIVPCVSGKILLYVVLLLAHAISQPHWLLVKVYNSSDLTLLRAARFNNVEIPSVSEQLHQGVVDQLLPMIINPASLFGSSGNCKIIAQTPEGKKIAFCFFGDPTHRVANGRALQADLQSRNAAALTKQSMLARVFMEHDTTFTLVGFAGYEQDNQQFALKLIGAQGNYVASLESIA